MQSIITGIKRGLLHEAETQKAQIKRFAKLHTIKLRCADCGQRTRYWTITDGHIRCKTCTRKMDRVK